MRVSVDGISKRYDYSWIINDWSYTFASGSLTGVTGRNGSGKSTMIKMLSGYLPPSKGEIVYEHQGNTYDATELYDKVSLVAPYTDLIREFTVKEMFAFHRSVRTLIDDLEYEQFSDIVQLPKPRQQIQYYSSGMNQRLQLALHLLSATPLVLLDEPTSYLDKEAKQWTYDLIDTYRRDRTIILSSNDQDDLAITQEVVAVKRTGL